ncbi:MAG: DUF4492 domain-containing protein [Puniceicoccales bacterium]|jgi:hypothetical protein|nr:DUF4492 domain-containing protein [Puniceicoccales bacterium]
MKRLIASVITFYAEGFRRMTLGKTLWAIILIKLFVIFAVLKLFFFPNLLNSRFDTPEQKSAYVAKQLTAPHGNLLPEQHQKHTP